ncbi:tryptophan 7-halogenase (plasmid) [Rhizobium sp. CB3171]|uniref:flavin-dependent monooxygenase QhpG n=1 Tax=Rhizobium sp. CB3171 TaxID=3039157 RepID=UPI0024B19CF3|nr:tryptophan 7-halogenase [Rhizobium sp. CB3171]WFU07492.1 tryptophan 7-halogenase [Rhizobium sp. CB3171]
MTGPCDVLVVGGGPAGAITALGLARLGYDVNLIEALPTPRPHIGESITIGVNRQLSHLGIEAALESGGRNVFFTREERWAEPTMTLKPAAPGAATINRSLFDAACLDYCRAGGVNVTEGQRTRSVERVKSCEWLVTVEGGSTRRARFVVDAAGKRSVLPRARETIGAKTIALYAYWSGDGLPALPRICAGAEGWAWGAPVYRLGYNITLFVDRSEVNRWGGDLRRAYLAGIVATGILDPESGPILVSEILACDATAWFDTACVGPGFVKVGEAALSLDPLASMGTQNAIQTALWATVVVNTALQRSEAGEAASEFFRQKVRSSAARHAKAIGEVYASHRQEASAPFWARRSAIPGHGAEDASMPAPTSGPWIAPSPTTHLVRGSVRVVDHACLCGAFVEMRKAVVVHDDVEPVAFLAGLELGDILNRVANACTVGELHDWLSKQQNARLADRILNWLVNNDVVRVVGPYDAGASRAPSDRGAH